MPGPRNPDSPLGVFYQLREEEGPRPQALPVTRQPLPRLNSVLPHVFLISSSHGRPAAAYRVSWVLACTLNDFVFWLQALAASQLCRVMVPIPLYLQQPIGCPSNIPAMPALPSIFVSPHLRLSFPWSWFKYIYCRVQMLWPCLVPTPTANTLCSKK